MYRTPEQVGARGGARRYLHLVETLGAEHPDTLRAQEYTVTTARVIRPN